MEMENNALADYFSLNLNGFDRYEPNLCKAFKEKKSYFQASASVWLERSNWFNKPRIKKLWK